MLIYLIVEIGDGLSQEKWAEFTEIVMKKECKLSFKQYLIALFTDFEKVKKYGFLGALKFATAASCLCLLVVLFILLILYLYNYQSRHKDKCRADRKGGDTQHKPLILPVQAPPPQITTSVSILKVNHNKPVVVDNGVQSSKNETSVLYPSLESFKY